MPAVIFPNTTSGASGQQQGTVSLPNPFLEWIRNQIHWVTGDDPKTPQIEGTLNLLTKALLENDRALLDYLTLLHSYISTYQAILNSIGPGQSRYHADSSIRGVHQDTDLSLNLLHQDSLVYGDTYILGGHDDYAYTGIHSDSGFHLDQRVVHSDFHSDHQDHLDASHGDRAYFHSDHQDHGDVIHEDTHGDATNPHQDVHSDHNDTVYQDFTQSHHDTHSDHLDIRNQVHCDVLHVDHFDSVHGDVPHANVAHEDSYSHQDHTSHDDYWDHSDHSDHIDFHADTYVDSHGDHNDGAWSIPHYDYHGDTHADAHSDFGY